ncbi:MAG: SLBB domain-containing protein [Verrucomicrobiota bacterium]
MNLAEQVQRAGVVGAGGGGFPTHVKLAAKADTLIANGAECEPLLHKDAIIMEAHATELVRGMQLAMAAVGAADGVVGIKGKKKHAVEAVTAACRGTKVRVQLLGDYYPAGDEYDLVFNVTGRLIPPGGIPINVGVVVNNVETFVNVAAAADGKPVTHKMLTIAGAVKSPVTLRVPLGTTYRDCLAAAGGLTTDDPVLCLGGLMMGQTTDDLDTPITKTATGVVILPRTHHTIERKLKPAKVQAKIGKSACDQCRYCTEYCPRFLLGYAVEPHQVMRSLAFTATGADYFNQWAAMCCCVRTLHAVCLPGGTVSQGSLRRVKGRDARQANQMDRADESQAAPDARRPPRPDPIAHAQIARGGLRFTRAIERGNHFTDPAACCRSSKARAHRVCRK